MRPAAKVLTLKLWAVAAIAGVVSLCGWAASGGTDILVSQKGRKFNPVSVTLSTGGTLEIFNDDGDLLHHAYVESDAFSFDSGDQKPGSRTRIKFTVPGDFKVLCGIHPKMKLAVHVQ